MLDIAHRRQQVTAFHSPWFLPARVVGLCVSELSLAQPAAKTLSAELVSVEQKGRTTTVTVQPEAGDPLTVIVTPRLSVAVVAPGDEGFLQSGQFVTALATMSNGRLFTKEVTVHLSGNKRPPAGKIAKAPPREGQSTNAYQVSGPIVSKAPEPDYPEYTVLALKVTGPSAPLLLEQDFTVQVRSSDVTMIPVGTKVELGGNELRGGRFNVTSLRAELSEQLNSAEVLAEEPAKVRP